MNSTMSVENAIETFTTIMRSLNTDDQQTFLSFVSDNWKPEEIKIRSLSKGNRRKEHSSQELQLNKIKQIIYDIRERVPFDGILSSERIIPPTSGENSDCDNKSTKHVDAFLYDNDEVDELIEERQLDNLYCADCGSNNVKEYNIISHSLSLSAMIYIFNRNLPSLKRKTLLDVGSRLGAVLYGVQNLFREAYVFTSVEKIIGVEMNKELCALQCDIVNKYHMNDRIDIVNRRIEECSDIVRKSNIIIMNNPFEFYVSESVHIEIWKFLKANIQSGTILITKPSIETTFKNLKTRIKVGDWVKPYEFERIVEETQVFGSKLFDFSEYSDIEFYEVL